MLLFLCDILILFLESVAVVCVTDPAPAAMPANSSAQRPKRGFTFLLNSQGT
jgi:hypothetical protein